MPIPSRGQTFGTPGGSRTHNKQGLNLLPLPIGLQEHSWEGGNRTPKLHIQSVMALPICLLPNNSPYFIQIEAGEVREWRDLNPQVSNFVDWRVIHLHYTLKVGWEGVEPPSSAHKHLIYDAKLVL